MQPYTSTTLADLREFVTDHFSTPATELAEIIRHRCQIGRGSWMEPPRNLEHIRPGTHLFEISFLGITGTGGGPTEAARNWRKAAIATLEIDEAREGRAA